MALADRFERSHERQEVRARAEGVDVAAIDCHKFLALLGALFPVSVPNSNTYSSNYIQLNPLKRQLDL